MPRVNTARPAADPLIRRFLAKKRYAETTRTRARWYLNHFADWCARQSPPLDLVAVSLDDLERYVEERATEGVRPGTLKQHVRYVRSFYRWCYDRRELDGSNPAVELEFPHVPETVQRDVSLAEHAAMVGACNRANLHGRRDAALLEVLRSTGMRRSELVRLDRADVDLEAGTARIVGVADAKEDEGRFCGLDEDAVDELSAYLRRRTDRSEALFVAFPAKGRLDVARRMGPDAVSYVVATTALRAIGRRVGTHEYRRTLTIWWLDEGGSQQGLERHNGWAPGSRMVRKYSRGREQRIAVEELDRLRRAAAERSRTRRREA